MESYNIPLLLFRRMLALVLGIAGFPFVCWSTTSRALFYSFVFRYWHKRSNEPVWLSRCSQHSDLLL